MRMTGHGSQSVVWLVGCGMVQVAVSRREGEGGVYACLRGSGSGGSSEGAEGLGG